MNQKNLRKIFLAVCVGLALVGVVLFGVGILLGGLDDTVILRVLVFLLAVLFLVAAGEFFYMYYIEKEVKPNYFLYDPQTKRNMSLEKMDFVVINRKMNNYLRNIAPSEGKIWTGAILEDPNLQMEDKFKPAVAYRLLFGLADKDADQGWKCFELATPETVAFICDALDSNGDTEVSRTLRHLKAANPMNIKYVRDYLVNNKSYIRTKLCNYVYDNINKF